MGKRFAKFRASEKRFRPSSSDDPSAFLVCAICKFTALDVLGLQMHRFQSPYCVSVDLPLPASLLESDDESQRSSQYMSYDYVGVFSSDNENDDINIHSPPAKVARLSSPGGVSTLGLEEEEDVGRYEFVSEHKFPANIDDEVHVELVELCRQIGAPLYAYNSILKWGQEAHAKGYTFPITALKYNAFMSDLAK
jgi:hypothetical protein